MSRLLLAALPFALAACAHVARRHVVRRHVVRRQDGCNAARRPGAGARGRSDKNSIVRGTWPSFQTAPCSSPRSASVFRCGSLMAKSSSCWV